MKCYICLTDSIVNRKDYFNMLKVTLISARKNTSLRLICLYDGKIGDPVYNLLKDFKVEIIIHELPYKKELMEYGYQAGKISMKEETVIFNKIEE